MKSCHAGTTAPTRPTARERSACSRWEGFARVQPAKHAPETHDWHVYLVCAGGSTPGAFLREFRLELPLALTRRRVVVWSPTPLLCFNSVPLYPYTLLRNISVLLACATYFLCEPAIDQAYYHRSIPDPAHSDDIHLAA